MPSFFNTRFETLYLSAWFLERGNLHQVTFQKGDKEEKMFIAANPQFKTLNLYDSAMKKVYQENERKEPRTYNGKEVSAVPKGSQKQSASAEEPDEALTTSKKQRKRRLNV